VNQVIPQSNSDENGWDFIVESDIEKDVREDLSKTVVEEGWGLLEMKPIVVSLEEVFLELTTEEKSVESERQTLLPDTEGSAEL